MKLSKQITIGYALMLILILLIGAFSVFSVYKLENAANNIEGRYKTLSRLISNPQKEVEFQSPQMGRDMINQALNIINEQVKYNYRIVFIVIGIVLLFGIVITFMFPRKITQPISQLVNATRSVRDGNYSYTIDSLSGNALTGNDEISELTVSFNEMILRIKETHEHNINLLERTKSFNNLLKEKVEEATRSLKEQQSELIKSERLATIGMMATKIAHEIKNPLSSISISLESIGRDGMDEYQSDAILEIQEEVKRLDRIIKELLNLASPRKLELTVVDPNEVVEKVVTIMKKRAHEKGIKLKTIYKCGYEFNIDYEKIEQVLINLLLNSVEAIEDKGEIVIETDTVDECLQIRVSDNGTGIPDTEINKIFDPFYSGKDHGTGLGLPISQKIIESHNGKIEVFSDVQKGTVFSITIPKLEEVDTSIREAGWT